MFTIYLLTEVSPATIRLPYPQLSFLNYISLGVNIANNCSFYSIAFKMQNGNNPRTGILEC